MRFAIAASRWTSVSGRIGTCSTWREDAVSERRGSTTTTLPPRVAIASIFSIGRVACTKLIWLTAGFVPSRRRKRTRSKSGTEWMADEPYIAAETANLSLQSCEPAE
ncbi:MAG: hypothetical protein U0230_08890 [Polyangiales bacterium]